MQASGSASAGTSATRRGGNRNKRKEREDDDDDDEPTEPAPAGASPQRPPRRGNSMAVIACHQCRARKIRCDSTRPHCANCARRGEVATCLYDAAPKRRGPDRRPGTRQRRCKSRKADELPRGASSDADADAAARAGSPMLALPAPTPVLPPPEPASPAAARAPALRISTDDGVLRGIRPAPASSAPFSAASAYAYDAPFARSAGAAYDACADPGGEHPMFPAHPSAAVHAAQQSWWDAFLRSYPLRDIATELDFLYTEPAISLAYINPRFLLETLWHPMRRLALQPAFVLASLALAHLLRSSESGRGAAGREQAAFLRQSAQDALELAWRPPADDPGSEGAGGGGAPPWVDASLAEAALLLALYEASAHPAYHPDRLARALRLLDDVLAALGLTRLDAARPDACRFAHGAAPVVAAPPPPPAACTCLPPGTPPPSARLPWDPSWGVRALRDEECRRVVWGALSLATSFRAECMALRKPDACRALRMCDPANYLVLFPNELYDRSGGGGGRTDAARATHPKNTIWALYCRSMLLANFCGNVVGDGGPANPPQTRDERETEVEELNEAWNEAQAIQEALDAHVCNLHTAVAYLCRENVYNSQMIITQGLRDLQGFPAQNRPGPLFNRRQAEEWIYYENEVIKDVTMSIQYLPDARGHHLTQRPFAVTWFYHQLAICLLLWESDGSLGDVLQLAKQILVPLDVMTALWPCDLIQGQCAALRKRLAAHCHSAGLDPPPPLPPASVALPRHTS
ncbi:hypothetical protein GGX14DRAFT_543424 [Mycena pura]|uniref:Zn(2)-C6 fungal-type domain-containing protein n=1 Tax=Mycena pura TaxID=153505 RepID=A0AAD6VBH4_9AGAR|nr:hypothetical protein GGX14DRAFT_543424 [Mycena pura]